MSSLEQIKSLANRVVNIKIILFDFDGTISTLRQGWEEIMEPLMVEMISGPTEPTPKLRKEVKNYIDESTGIQTIFQMKWLADKVEEYGLNPDIMDCWEYKAEYNRRLLNMVNSRISSLEKGESNPADFRIKGSYDFLAELKRRGYQLFVASGTDHPDVLHETEILGVKEFFTTIAGAPVDRADDSKKAVISRLLIERNLKGAELLIIGDGKVEIALGVEHQAITLGMATDEVKRQGINDWKRQKLIKAGAHGITGDFIDYKEIIDWLGL